MTDRELQALGLWCVAASAALFALSCWRSDAAGGLSNLVGLVLSAIVVRYFTRTRPGGPNP